MTADTYPNLYAALQHIDAIASTGWLHQDSLSHAGLVELLQEIIDAAREAMPAAHQAAAAPDMLAALTDLVEQLEAIGIPEWSGAEGLCLAQSRAAIAKAGG